MFEIYLGINQIDEKIYVGQTRRGLSLRRKEHLRDAEKGIRCLLYYAMRKYGANRFVWSVVARAESQEEANRLEVLWINILGTTDPKVGYNMTEGGVSVVLTSEKSRKIKSEKLKKFHSTPEINHPQYRKDIPTSEIIRLYASGMSCIQVAKHFGVSGYMIWCRLQKARVDTKKVTDVFELKVLELYPTGLSGIIIAGMLGSSPTKVYNCLKNNGVPIRSRSIRQLPPILKHKKCIGCKQTKPLDDFHKNKNRRDGRRNLCKVCVSSYDKQRPSKKKAA